MIFIRVASPVVFGKTQLFSEDRRWLSPLAKVAKKYKTLHPYRNRPVADRLGDRD